jgi:hypothetical protein
MQIVLIIGGVILGLFLEYWVIRLAVEGAIRQEGAMLAAKIHDRFVGEAKSGSKAKDSSES